MTCIITGCRLVDLPQQRSVWGDLHRIGEDYVFNAVTHSDTGEAAWSYHIQNTWDGPVKQLKFVEGSYFERRGVVVLAKGDCNLNPAAIAYLGDNV